MGVIDPDVARFIKTLNQMFPVPPTDATPAQRRQSYREVQSQLLHPAPPEPFGGEIREEMLVTEAGEVPVRVYNPVLVPVDGPVVVMFPGGGWVIGDLETGDATSRAIATQMGVTVISVDYRKAPEHAFPAAFDDCRGVVISVAQQRRPSWLGVAGDSSGGNLAAAVAVACAASGYQCDGQMLLYPALDPTMDTDSHRRYGRGYLLEHDVMRFYWDSYRATAEPDARMAPLLAPDELLARVAPLVLSTAEFDPLHDEGRDYARRLVSLGVPAAHLPGDGLVHGWVDHTRLVPAAGVALRRAVAVFDAMRGTDPSTAPRSRHQPTDPTSPTA